MASISISNVEVNFNMFKEENKMTNVAYYLNDVAVSYEEAAEFVPVTEKNKKVVKATTAKKIADLAGFLATRYNCSFAAAYAASIQGGCRPAAEKLLSDWTARNWEVRRKSAAELAEMAEQKRNRFFCHVNSKTTAAEEALEEEIALADKAARKAAKKAVGKRHYDAIISKVVRTAKVVKVRADRSITKMERELHAELVMSQFITDLAKVDKAKARRVWESARAVFLRVTAIISKSARKAARKAVASIEAANELIARIDAAKAEDARSSIGAADMSAVNKLSLELAMETIQSMFNSNNNRTGIRGIDWVDDSRLIDEDIASECAERQKEDNMFKFDLQLFAGDGHKASKSYVRSLKSNDGNAMAYSLKVLPNKETEGIYVILGREMAEITPLNKHLVKENGSMIDLRGREVFTPRYFDGYATMDVSAVVGNKNKSICTAGATLAMRDILIGKYREEAVVCVRDDGFDDMVVISKKYKSNGDRYFVPMKVAFDENGELKAGWNLFGEYKLYSSSKGRQNKFDMFSDENFESVLDKATYGEWTKVKGLSVTTKEVAEEVTRLGSKSCRMGTNQIVENITIVLGKDNSTDGAGLISNIGIKNGYLVQCRPYTAKGAALVVSSKTMEAVEGRHNAVVWDKKNLTKRQEEILDLILNKQKQRMHGKGFDDMIEEVSEEIKATAIKLVGNPDKGTQVFGDLNFWKDMWDYKRDSALNILDVANFVGDDFKHAATSGQLLKVLMRAANDTYDKELVMDIKRFLAKTIKDEMTNKILDLGADKFDGTELLNPGFMSGAVRSLNANSWTSDPGIFKNVILDKINSIKENFQRDRYGINGYSAMVTVDLAHFLSRGKISILKHETNDKDEVVMFELYDPAANRYLAKTGCSSRYGAVVKYPSMGTKEACIVKFVSDEEMMERIDASAFTADHKALLKDEIKNLKEGAVMAPKSLDVLAMILAGFDLDGDHLEVLLPSADGNDIATFLMRSGFVPASVHINPPKPNNIAVEHPFSCKAWASYAYKIIKSGNKSVGIVTNSFRLFTDGLLQDMNKPNVHKFYKDLFVAMGATNGKKDYESVVGFEKGVYICKEDCMHRFLKAIKNVNLDNVNNIIAMLNDMDKLGRFCQELTIDAQKKFYKVLCDWMDNIDKFSLFVLNYGISFDTVMAKDDFGNEYIADFRLIKNAAYVVNNKKIIPTGDLVVDNDKTILADAFTLHRVYAANIAVECFLHLLNEYNKSRAEYADAQEIRETRLGMILSRLNAGGFEQVKRVARAMFTVSRIYAENIAAANEKLEQLNIPVAKIKAKIEKDIKKGASADFSTMIDAISNEIRRICAENDMDTLLVSEALTLDGIIGRGGIASQVLREERLVNIIESSETKMFTTVLRATNALKKWLVDTGAETVQIAGGVFYNIGCDEFFGMDVESNLVDGVYKLFVNNNGELCVSRPGREFVDMSGINVDHDCRVIANAVFHEDESAIIALDNKLNDGDVYTVYGNTRDSKYALLDATGEKIVDLNFGNPKEHIGKSKAPTVLSKGYRDFAGKLVAKTVSTTSSGGRTVEENGVKKEKFFYNYIVVLHK